MFSLALLSIPLWAFTKNPTYSIVLITLIDIFAFAPTLRKTWNDPESETLISYAIAGLKYLLAVGAIGRYDFSRLLYPITLVIMNLAVIGVILSRTKVVSPLTATEP